MTKRELDEKFLFFNPEIVFDGTIGGIKLLMTVDAFNGAYQLGSSRRKSLY